MLPIPLKESAVALVNGVVIAITTAAAVELWTPSYGLALVVAVSMLLSMIAAGLAGVIIPVALMALRQDPAQSSSIFLTTVTDAVALVAQGGLSAVEGRRHGGTEEACSGRCPRVGSR